MAPSQEHSQPRLGAINEVCIVTPSLYKTIDNLSRTGIGPFRVFRFDSTTVPKQQLHETNGSNLFEILVAFAHAPNPKDPVIEIMQPVKGQTPMQDYLDTHNNQEGVQHIAFDMRDESMGGRIAAMRGRGFKPAMQGWWQGKQGVCHFVFFDTAEKGIATCFETIEFSDDWEEPDFEWYPRPPEVAAE